MARDYARDYRELPKFAEQFKGKTTMECIEATPRSARSSSTAPARRSGISPTTASSRWRLSSAGSI